MKDHVTLLKENDLKATFQRINILVVNLYLFQLIF